MGASFERNKRPFLINKIITLPMSFQIKSGMIKEKNKQIKTNEFLEFRFLFILHL